MNEFVWLVSYPRSGNTWLRLLLANYQHPGERRGYRYISEVVPDFHQFKNVQRTSYQQFIRQHFGWSPVVIKCHYQAFGDYNKVIYIYRDGRDVLLSYFRYFSHNKKHALPFSQYFTKFLRGETQFGSWKNHVSWWFDEKYIRPVEVKYVKYEDLLAQPEKEFAEVVKFLNLKVDKELIKDVVRATEYKKCREFGAAEGLHYDLIGRNGVSGSWKEMFSAEQTKYFWDWAGSLMERLGYKE